MKQLIKVNMIKNSIIKINVIKQRLIIAMISLSLLGTATYAENIPRGVAADHRVKVVLYDPNNIVTLHAKYGYQTQITFAPNETIQNVSLGDSMAWLAVPANNNLFIKPITASNTNLTVLTNLNSYSFQLDSRDQTINPTYKLQFIYPAAGFNGVNQSNAIATFDPNKLNSEYSFTGEREIVPIQAFDNGQFTYFKFKKDGMSRLPAIFIVDKNRHETLVNDHQEGDYVVVDTVAKEFTFRDGSVVASIYNDAAIGDWNQIEG